ncbi:MAG: RNA polymerase subunit sigma-70 [Rhodospirillales bacterium]|jgi:hypothetical protein|nr:RNA polymerase subunit sigma-70 [Rhodospirillales bacterium]MBT4006073.1 RNA polymerase subunit sigma-70 [Rhodospirillales bacterium]MBT5075763.1 RNA polymerase subunit sigma-70 [Rhodospirillales bacterium]MBT5112816.1 RNA polymerase subunit sigma-70 [Rhodospirillales bacterium]MBT5673586.1 RNA polymerase subunit sigma-70 [Rhodospirillales bacterium]
MSEAIDMDKTATGSGAYASSNITHLSKIDVTGAGQVSIQGQYAYLGYMYGPEGTSIVDISDPRDPKIISTVMLENDQSHSHKVRVIDDIMVVNSEWKGTIREGYEDGGVRIYDISDKANPKLITFLKTFGKGVHRFDMDENYLYLSTEVEGFTGNILAIYDFKNPASPDLVSHWWMPGQNTAGGETPHPKGKEHRLHHALRFEDELYAGFWGSGFGTIDISDITKPKTMATYDVHPPALEPSHTLLRVPFPVGGRNIALATDEERTNRGDDDGKPHAPFYVFDVTDRSEMKLLSTYHVAEEASPYHGDGIRFGAHQLRETIDDTLAYVTWFAAGLRILDFSDPENITEAGFFIPPPGKNQASPLTNDVQMDDRGLIYTTDKARGFDVIEMKR